MSIPGTVSAIIHNLLHQHARLGRDGLGTFSVCTLRLTGRSQVLFRPDYTAAGWHEVPAVKDASGTPLFERMAAQATPEAAMALLRKELA